MQATLRAQSAVTTKASRAVAPRALRVLCRAQTKPVEVAKKAALATVGLPALITACPAFALVDERLNGDGTGLPFGINDGVLGWIMVGMFTFIWVNWFIAQKDLGDFEDEDAGLKIK